LFLGFHFFFSLSLAAMVWLWFGFFGSLTESFAGHFTIMICRGQGGTEYA
jgi:hypothetical protein